MLDSDYRGKTVLLHAAGAGRKATFDAVLGAISNAFSDEEVRQEHAYICVPVIAYAHAGRQRVRRYMRVFDNHVHDWRGPLTIET